MKSFTDSYNTAFSVKNTLNLRMRLKIQSLLVNFLFTQIDKMQIG